MQCTKAQTPAPYTHNINSFILQIVRTAWVDHFSAVYMRMVSLSAKAYDRQALPAILFSIAF